MTSLRAAALILLTAFTAFTAPAAAAPQDPIAAGATEARQRCYALLHEDTFEYRDCLLDLLKAEPEPPLRRLGIEYFGWVGALASQRTAMAGARETANEFLWRFRRTQHALKVDDQRLCASVEGTCSVRIAQMKQAEAALGGKAPPPLQPHEAEPRTPERP